MDLVSIVERMARLEPAALDAGGVTAALRDVSRLKGFVADIEHGLARRADELAAAGAGAPAGETLGAATKCSKRQAERTARRAATLHDLPAMSAQLAKGRIGTEHADAVANAAGRLAGDERAALLALDDELARAAASSDPSRFRRTVDRLVDQLAADRGLERAERQRHASHLTRGINDQSGMYWLHAELDPESGARLFGAIDAEVAGLASRAENETARRDQLAARALVDLATSASRSRRPGRVELLALVDLDTLTDGLRADSTCELGDGTDVPVATMRRLACDADIVPVVLGGDGVVLDVGRSSRLATPDQRRALRAMYRTCGVGDCDVPFDRCEVHHLTEWGAHHGDTDLDELIPACRRHHHLAHEGRWQLTLDPITRELTVRLPDGTVHSRSRPDSVAAATAGRAA